MTNKEHFLDIMNRKSSRCGFWHGSPHGDSTDALYRYFGVKDDFELGLKLGSIFTWASPDWSMWKHPSQIMFNYYTGAKIESLSQDGVFAYCEDIGEVDAFLWPSVEYCDFTETIAEIDRIIKSGQAVVSGAWSCFFHNVADFFGMENYFVKMHTNPEIVLAVTERVVDFYLEVNEKFYAQAKGKIDAFFFGNDFGSQLDLLVSPECFDRFIMPYFIKFTKQAHRHGLKVMLHSCGSIGRVIERLIDMGVDALHPIQALAAGMDAETLSEKYNDKIVFIGGVDTQQLLPFGTPQQVKDEVRRLKRLFGTNFIVSPSHEAILPNVPPENIAAMAEAALE